MREHLKTYANTHEMQLICLLMYKKKIERNKKEKRKLRRHPVTVKAVYFIYKLSLVIYI